MLCILFFCVICEKKNIFETRWGVFSLTDLTDLTEHFSALFNSWGLFSLTEHTEFTEHFAHSFEPTEGLRHTEFTERYCQRWL